LAYCRQKTGSAAWVSVTKINVSNADNKTLNGSLFAMRIFLNLASRAAVTARQSRSGNQREHLRRRLKQSLP
jgi:hypothetical protein